MTKTKESPPDGCSDKWRRTPRRVVALHFAEICDARESGVSWAEIANKFAVARWPLQRAFNAAVAKGRPAPLKAVRHNVPQNMRPSAPVLPASEPVPVSTSTPTPAFTPKGQLPSEQSYGFNDL